MKKKINIIKAYYILNMKMLLREKISFIWSIVLPAVMIVMYQENGYTEMDMRYYYAYIIFSSYLFGVGLHSIQVRQSGSLKVFFSIREARYEFFIANILTQITYSCICVSILNVIITILYKLNFLILCGEMLIMIIGAIPIAFASCVLSLIKNVRYGNINTVATICVMIFLFLIKMPFWWNIFNPLYLTSNILLIHSWRDFGIYILISTAAIFMGIMSIRHYSVISGEVR
ncbi:MAG: hypothetical protein ACI4DQ_09435 [Lachnospiraceae bacterium]